MDIRELEKLAVWYNEHFDRIGPLYHALIAPIQHNATQLQKIPVEEPLNDLIRQLRRTDFETLSIEQLNLLDNLGNVRSYLDSFLQSLSQLALRNQEEESDFITIRVSFQNEASITNMTEWKRSASDWYDIIRGIAMVHDEAPEDIRVVSATKGSIILTLAAGAAVTELLARIAKHITGTAKDVLELAHSREDLKQKKMLTTVMADEFDRLTTERKANTVQEIVGEFKDVLGDGAGDKLAALTKSVEKLLKFNEKGGTVDFVMPENDDDEDEVDEAEAQAAVPSHILAAKRAIQDYQEVREQVKLLSHHKADNDE